LEHQKDGASASSSSVSNSKSPLQLVQQPKSPNYPFDAGSGGSDSRDPPFDICLSLSKCTIKLARPLLEINREKRREKMLSKDVAPCQYLRPGMVLLKRFLKPDDQVRICLLMLLLSLSRFNLSRLLLSPFSALSEHQPSL
jgi:hypothetical protein